MPNDDEKFILSKFTEWKLTPFFPINIKTSFRIGAFGIWKANCEGFVGFFRLENWAKLSNKTNKNKKICNKIIELTN